MRVTRHKFRAQATERDGIRFDSKKEAKRYDDLRLLQRSGEVLFFLRQVPFDIGAGVKYRLDFLVFWRDGDITFEDVKGFRTKEYLIKKRLVESLYPITIQEI